MDYISVLVCLFALTGFMRWWIRSDAQEAARIDAWMAVEDPLKGAFNPARVAPPLDQSNDATLDSWCAQPAYDTRTLSEFAAEGGRPACPPNRRVVDGVQPGPPRRLRDKL